MFWWARNDDDHNRRRDDVSTAEVARRLDQHMMECREDKIEFHKKLDDHSEDLERKHAENLTRFARIDRTIYIATGVAMAIAWAMTHGSEVVAKILK